MFKNYLKIAVRTLRRHKGYTFINIFGLAVGMAACLIIGLYISSEFSYDGFHDRADRIMAIGSESEFNGETRKFPSAPYALADALDASTSEVQQSVFAYGMGERTVRRADTSFAQEQRVLAAGAAFFEMFSFPLLRGDLSSVLDAPQQAVITQSMARTFFGETNPLGKTLSFERRGETYQVTVAGVARDVPQNSTIQFDMVVPTALVFSQERRSSWTRGTCCTYVRLHEQADPEAFTASMQRVIASHRHDASGFTALPLTEWYLSDYYHVWDFSGEQPQNVFRGQRRYVYLFGTIALLILLIAAINYVNLVTAQGERRAHEVGVHKAVGARREQLAGQFMSETALLSLGALGMALVLVGLALPGFNALLGTDLSLDAARSGPALLGLSAFVLVVSVAASAYPAFVLSRFRPTEVLRGRGGSGGGGGSWLRRGLVVTQFAVSAGLILCTAVVYQQLHFMQTERLGFDGEQVVTVALPVSEERQQVIKREVLRQPGVERASVADAVPGGFRVVLGGKTRRRLSSAAQPSEDTLAFRPAKVDADYVETMGLKLLAGRGFSPDHPSDRTQGYVLNQAAAEAMGWTPTEAVGKPFIFARGKNAPEGSVLGVVENFHIESLRDPIGPVVLQTESERFSSSSGVLAAKLAPDRIGAAMEHIEAVVAAQMPEAEAFDYTFLDEKFDAMYRAETRLAQMFAVFAGIAVLVACLGLFGLTAFAAERRTREIAIRKVLGASVGSVVGLLSREFALLVAVALVLGTPVAYWSIQQWLTEFAYHVEIGPWMFALTAAVALSIAGASTSYHALRAALANPTDALRDE